MTESITLKPRYRIGQIVDATKAEHNPLKERKPIKGGDSIAFVGHAVEVGFGNTEKITKIVSSAAQKFYPVVDIGLGLCGLRFIHFLHDGVEYVVHRRQITKVKRKKEKSKIKKVFDDNTSIWFDESRFELGSASMHPTQHDGKNAFEIRTILLSR